MLLRLLVPVVAWPLVDVIDMIKTSPRPILLDFRKQDQPIKSPLQAPMMPSTNTCTNIETKTKNVSTSLVDSNQASNTNQPSRTNVNLIDNAIRTIRFYGHKPLGLKFQIDGIGNVLIVGLDPDGQAEVGGMLVFNSVLTKQSNLSMSLHNTSAYDVIYLL